MISSSLTRSTVSPCVMIPNSLSLIRRLWMLRVVRSLYILALFTIGNLHFLVNDFCLDVFKFFWCHFPFLNPFGVARVTTFVVVCKAYSGKAIVPLFRSFLNLGPAGDWLTFQKRSGSDIPTHFDLSSSWEHAQNVTFIFVNEDDMAFRNSMKKPSQSPSFSVRPSDQLVYVGKGVAGLKLAVVGENVIGKMLMSPKGLEYGRYGISKVLDTAVLPSSGYGVLILFPSWSFGECRPRYAISSLMDMAYWMSEQ
nr:hypothetical protein [Tanacetum cinerariifolium]